MIKAGQIEKGTALLIKGQPFLCIEREFVNPGKGSAFVRLKLKSPATGQTLSETMKSQDNAEDITIEDRTFQYLYNDGDLYYFMDTETYEQLPLNHEQVEDAINYIIENDTVTVRFFKGNPFSVQPANFVTLTVTECEPGVRGDTATGANKPATVETGLKIVVPLFVNEGDKVRIDTRTGEYMERV